MSESDAAALAGAGARAMAEPNDHLPPQDKSKTNAAPSTTDPAAHTGNIIPLRGELSASEAAPSEISSPGVTTPLSEEIELKLLVDADRLADFNDAPVIATHAHNKGTRKHLKSVYYDTPERTLWRNGLTLRVRQSGARFVQTVKAEIPDDPLRRGEWEASVPSMAPDLALAMPFIPAKLRADLERGPLEPVFKADVHRHQRMIDLPSGSIEIAFDQGLLKAGGRSMPVSEIELELKSGSRTAIYELALRLAEYGPVRPSIRAKSARGFDLAADAPPRARKPRKLRLDPSISLDDAFATILRTCLQHLLESLPAAEDGRDPEGIHQLRVALRRIRSAVDLMRTVVPLGKLEALRSEARWLAQNLSAARDWDIFYTKTLPAVAQACSSIAGFDVLSELSEKRQLEAYRNARTVLADRRCADFVIGLGGWIEARGWRSDAGAAGLAQLTEPALNFASRMLAAQQAKVLKRGRGFKSLDADQRHRLRLAAKKLRYIADFLLPLYGDRKSARRFSDKLSDLQKDLGSYNDIATTKSLIAELGTAATDHGGPAAAAIAGWQAHAMVDVERSLRDIWRDFAKAKVPWSTTAEA